MKTTSEEGVPVYLRIVEQIKRQILAGRYRAGEKLPSVRELAMELRVNPNTVAKAYAILQQEKVVEARQGGGNFVSQSEEEAGKLSCELVRKELGQAIDTARRLHFTPDEIRTIVEEYLNNPNGKEPDHV